MSTVARSSVDSAGAGVTETEGASYHERAVAFVQALSHTDTTEEQCAVWLEHSYAARDQAGGAGAGGGVRMRVLLRPAPPTSPPATALAPDAPLDVCGGSPRPRPPTPDSGGESGGGGGNGGVHVDVGDGEGEEEEEEEEWEQRVMSLAPSAAHRRVAEGALAAVAGLVWARATGAGGRGALAGWARRLRRALAGAWAAPAVPPVPPAPSWLHGVLLAYLPAQHRAAYTDMIQLVAARLPTLAARLGGGVAVGGGPGAGVGPGAEDSEEEEGAGVGVQQERLVVVWVSAGLPRLERRWTRVLRRLLPLHVLPQPPPVGECSVEAWCGGVGAACKASLAEVVGAGGGVGVGGGVVLCGLGAGAALSVCGARGGWAGRALRGLVLVAPPLLTAEGGRARPDDPLCEVPVPVLLLAAEGAGAGGGAGVGGDVGACAALLPAHAQHRAAALHAADALLRPSLQRTLHHRLTLTHVIHALAEEVARWVRELEAELLLQRAAPAHSPSPASAPAHAPAPAPQLSPAHSPPPAPAAGLHMPSLSATSAASGSAASAGRGRARAADKRPAHTQREVDIMRLPVVFADESPPRAPRPSPAAGPAAAAAAAAPRPRGRPPNALKRARLQLH